MTRASRAEVWDTLLAAQLVAGTVPPNDEEAATPWYMRALLGIAGWVAAAFLMGFIGAGLAFVIDSDAISIITGLAIVAGSYWIFRAAGAHAFATQFAVAVSFAGQMLVWSGIEPGFRDAQGEWLIIAVFHALLAVVLPNFILRVWCAGAAATAIVFMLSLSHGYFLAPGILAAATAFVWLHELHWPRVASAIRAIGYGLTLVLILVQATAFGTESLHGLSGYPQVEDWVPRWVGWLLPAVVLVVVVWRLLVRSGASLHTWKAVAMLLGAAAVGAASFKAPGVATGMMLMLLGFANANRFLLVLGLIALMSYLSAYYYQLETTLLIKSLILAATGAVLLAVRWVVVTVVFPEPEAGRA